MTERPGSPRRHWLTQRSVLVVALALLARGLVVALGPDGEVDAYGHVNIARAVLREPQNLAVHWVWLPGWHFLVAGLLWLGSGTVGVRLFNAALAVAAPCIVYRWLAPRGVPTALLAAEACALIPVANRLGTTAMPETLFALLLLLAAVYLEAGRGLLAGVSIALACALRFEAWGVVFALGVAWAWRRVPVWTWVPGAVVAGSWIVLQYCHAGELFRFAHETQRFSSGLRAGVGLTWFVDLLLMPLALPWLAFGPALALLPRGLRRGEFGIAWLVPAAALAVVVVTYLLGAAMPLDRYLTVTAPFVAVLLARGAEPRGGGRSWTKPLLATLAATTLCHLGWVLVVGAQVQREFGSH